MNETAHPLRLVQLTKATFHHSNSEARKKIERERKELLLLFLCSGYCTQYS
jgi:hypothetical protein